MRTCNCKHPLALQDVLRQPLWARNIGQALIEDFFHQGIATGNHVANHVNIGVQFGLLGRKPFNQLNPLRLELGTHGRIHIRITASNTMPRLLGQHRNAAHKCTANT